MGWDLFMNIQKTIINFKLVYIVFGLGLIFHALILFRLIFFPYPELFIYPYLVDQGLLPYKQILDQHFPGLMFLPINLHSLGMLTPNIARVWLVTVVLLTQIILFLITKKITKSSNIALLSSFLYLIWQPFFEGWILWIDTFLPLFYLPAFYFTYQALTERNIRAVFLSGLLLGLGLLFKQVTSPLIVLVFILIWIRYKDFKILTFYLIGIFPVPVLMCLYLISIGVFSDFWYWAVVFNLTTFAKFGRKLPFLSEGLRMVTVYTPALLSLMLKDFKLGVTLLVFILGSLASIYARFDFIHLQPSLPFVALGTALIFDRLKSSPAFKFISLGYLAVVILLLTIFYKGHLSNKVYFYDANMQKTAQTISSLTHQGEEIFIFGPPPHLYQLTHTLPAGKVFIFQFPWFMMEAEGKILTGLRESKPRLIVAQPDVTIEGKNLFEFAPNINRYINDNYSILDSVGSYKILKRKND